MVKGRKSTSGELHRQEAQGPSLGGTTTECLVKRSRLYIPMENLEIIRYFPVCKTEIINNNMWYTVVV